MLIVLGFFFNKCAGVNLKMIKIPIKFQLSYPTVTNLFLAPRPKFPFHKNIVYEISPDRTFFRQFSDFLMNVFFRGNVLNRHKNTDHSKRNTAAEMNLP